MAEQVSQRLGRYQLGEVIGVGSFATVYRATDDRLEDTVVLKVLAENHSLNPEVRARFIAEGRALRRISGPHVITVHDIGESPSQQPYLVLEYADRGTLAGRVAELRSGGWTPTTDEILALAVALAAAVDDVHAARMVHRDLSPGNLLLQSLPHTAPAPAGRLIREDERLVLADLGMCKDLALNSGLTVAGGTAGFRPPEQDGGPGIVDHRADLWAMSALLDWLVRPAEMPPRLAKVLRRGMSEQPSRRQPDVTAWVAEITEALRPEPAVPPAATVSAPPGQERSRRQRWPWLLGVGLVLGLVLGSWLGWLLASDTPPARVDGAAIAIDGPDEIAIGESAMFSVEVAGVEGWVWTLPTGAHVVDDRSVTLSPSTPGRAEIVLRARTPEGEDLETVHEFDVTE